MKIVSIFLIASLLAGCSDKLPAEYIEAEKITESVKKFHAWGYTNIHITESGWLIMNTKEGGELSIGPMVEIGNLRAGESKTFFAPNP